MWEHLDRKIRLNKKIINKESLKNAIKEEWVKISSDYTKKLVESMPRRLEAVRKNHGQWTKYLSNIAQDF